MAGTSLNSSPSRDCVVMLKTSSPLTSLSFRPQGEILDPSHSFGMTIRSPAIATHSPTGEERGGGCFTLMCNQHPILVFPHQRFRNNRRTAYCHPEPFGVILSGSEGSNSLRVNSV